MIKGLGNPENLGGIWVEIDDLPDGEVLDGIEYIQNPETLTLYRRAEKSPLTLQSVGIKAGVAGQFTRLQEVLDSPKVTKLVMSHSDLDAIINLGGIVDAHGKHLVFEAGTTFSNGTIVNYYHDADPLIHVFEDDLIAKPIAPSMGFFSPHNWGIFPESGVWESDPMQRCMDAAEYSALPRVQFSLGGTYKISDLVIGNWSGTYQADMSTVRLTGNNIGAGYIKGVRFFNDNVNSAILHIQLSRDTHIDSITFQGRVSAPLTHVSTRTDATTGNGWRQSYEGEAILNGLRALHCGIDVDGLSNAVSSPDRFPATKLTPYYGNAVYGGTSGLRITHCNFRDLLAGVAHGLAGVANGDNIYISGGEVENCRSFIVAGQLQSRAGTVENVYVAHSVKYFLNGGEYGTQNGSLPKARNCSINQSEMWYYNNSEFSSVSFTDCYGEGMFKVGISTTGNPQTFSGCEWGFSSPDDGMQPAKLIIDSGGPVNITGGIIQGNGGYYPGPITFKAPAINMNGVFIRTGIMTNVYMSGGAPIPINYRGCEYFNTATILNDNEHVNGVDTSIVKGFKFEGSSYKSIDNVTHFPKTQKTESFYIESPTVTYNSGTKKSTFTSSFPGEYGVGAVLVSNEFSFAPIGIVESVVGSTVTLNYVPVGFTSGAYSIFTVRQPKVQNRILGDIINGTPNVSNILGTMSFVAGDIIKGAGIPDNTKIISITGTSMLLSKNVTTTAQAVELYDAKMYCESDTSVFQYFGGPYTIWSVGRVWYVGDYVNNLNGGPIVGWYVSKAGYQTNGTHPPEFRPITDYTASFDTVSVFTDPGIVDTAFSALIPAGKVLETVYVYVTANPGNISMATDAAFTDVIVGPTPTINSGWIRLDPKIVANSATTVYFKATDAPGAAFFTIKLILKNIP